MQTVLDEAWMWQLHAVLFQDDLRLILTEMFVGDADDTCTDPNPILQKILRETRPTETRDDSRMILVRFPQTVAWQVVDESYTSWDDYEVRDGKGALQVLSRSKYLDYVNANHGWYRDIIGAAEHYRVWTSDAVVDIVACEKPEIGPWQPAPSL
ncbi:hypothetical protein [Rubinisphaera sp. JC750]|uniref:hypothetical protein n=1 Tax=Rubinisphaera sp. JC750 TaxID=2898658 RepID=UPI001F255069|nr:hypothetical protein [Rubinisphaera sp. JC750]